MWYYYGNKRSIVQDYYAPEYDTIIEPFCGAAHYSLFGDHWERKVILVDKYPVVARLWKWLVKDATPQEILSLPDLKKGDKVDDISSLCEEERNLIGFFINRGVATPAHTVANYSSWNEKTRQNIADTLPKIRHWEVIEGSYEDVPNQPATWFIDPPYQYGGEHYKCPNKDINFAKLAEWCKSREGQVIVCENTKADWLPFRPLVKMSGQKHDTVEAIWTNKKYVEELF